MNGIKVFILICFLCYARIGYSQISENEAVFFGRIIDLKSKQPVSYCPIYNESKRTGQIAEASGEFSLAVSVGDTLVFLALGYNGKTYIITKENCTNTQTIGLLPRSYEIEEVKISLPRTYKGLKTAILNLDTDKLRPIPELPEYNPYKTPLLLDTNIINSAGFKIMHPVSGFYYKYSKEEKSKRKVFYAKEQELKQPEVDRKYNRNLVQKKTGLQNDSLTNFIGFCNFEFNYLYNSTDLEILQAIEKKYKEFMEAEQK